MIFDKETNQNMRIKIPFPTILHNTIIHIFAENDKNMNMLFQNVLFAACPCTRNSVSIGKGIMWSFQIFQETWSLTSMGKNENQAKQRMLPTAPTKETSFDAILIVLSLL